MSLGGITQPLGHFRLARQSTSEKVQETRVTDPIEADPDPNPTLEK